MTICVYKYSRFNENCQIFIGGYYNVSRKHTSHVCTVHT